jgi:polyribonucleotide nucleotidyltransferase
MRPLFPKDYRNDVTLENLVMSVDPDCSPELTAMIGTAIAVTISDIPFDGPCAMTQVGLVDGKFVINPTNDQKKVSDLALTVASVKDKVIMIEAGAKEVPEQVMIDAIYEAHEVNKKLIAFINEIRDAVGKEKQEYVSAVVPEELMNAVKEIVPQEVMETAVFSDDKMARDKAVDELTERCREALADKEEWLPLIGDAMYQYEKKTVRKMILKDHKRPDGRQITEIRPLSAEIDLLPRVHGSAMFTRGQTQIVDVCTLAPLSEVQRIEGMDVDIKSKRYLHQYNFPSYSVGETRVSRGPGRREIGHGALAERALLPMIPDEEEFPYAIRCVSETMESNGSTSQASVCASSLALMAAGVPIKRPVAGISCGLVTGETDDDYLVLTDIQGIEDFFGDMDFKVAGTEKGITAIQMDIKIHGLTRPIVEEAIARTREARMYILNNIMNPVIAEPRPEVSKYAPKIVQIKIDPKKIGDVVGKQGKVINKIIEDYGVQIDIEEDGSVNVSGIDQEMIDKAVQTIKNIVTDIEAGMVFTGPVVRILEFGAFVSLTPNKDGMIHISRLADRRVAKVEDVVNIGDEVTVKVIKVDAARDRIDLTMRPSDMKK